MTIKEIRHICTCFIFKIQVILLVIFLHIFIGCTSENEKQALIKVEKTFHTESCSLDHQEVFNNFGEEIDKIKLTLNFKKINTACANMKRRYMCLVSGLKDVQKSLKLS